MASKSTGLAQSNTASKAVDLALSAIEQWNPSTKAMLAVTPELARATARELDDAASRGEWRGVLHGMTISLKDNVDLEGVPTTAGSPLLANNVPKHDAHIVKKLKANGAIIVGKANLHEWVFGPTSQSKHYGPVRNPWNTDHIPGGSSGGSGASVAAEMCVASIGSDTGGSIRIPSALNGVAGIRPTIGRISNTGSVAVSAKFDTLGPLAYRVMDVARVFSVIAGYDPEDPISKNVPVPDFLPHMNDSVKGLRIGIPRAWFFDGLDPDLDRALGNAIDTYRRLGVELVEVDLRDAKDSQAMLAFTVIVADAYNIHRERIEKHRESYGEDVLARALLGEKVSGAQYAAALRWNEEWRRKLRDTFERVDAILAPATPGPAPVANDPRHFFDKIREVTKFMSAWAFPGIPALAVPCGFAANGLPVGMQLAGRWFGEPTILRLGHAFQKVTDFHLKRPTFRQ